ncbi:hypothetical protein [Streptomyces sp. CC208A]|uniref:hypothetical protein n=1 Tax=Streptomyces sp. CC208A TaxID=3044573 RepID=UPI0024A7F9C8|nr:hypothetical protein [Streptomyces sp. CC208A]
MAAMRRGLVHALAWSLATGAAVTLSWWGVHTVLSGTVYDPPRALPLPLPVDTSADRSPAGTAIGDAVASSTSRPAPPSSPSPPPSSPSPPPSTRPARAPDRPTPAPTATAGPSAPSSGSSGVRSHTVDGGRVAFDLGGASGELVSAVPASGWRMQVWKQPTWIRVTFTRDEREISVFCLWHDSAPRVQIEERAT